MPMTQQDIRQHYETEWKRKSDNANDTKGLAYSNPVEDALLYPLYEQLIADLKIRVHGGRVLDVGCGSGRWVRYFLQRFAPQRLLGIDFAQSSIDLLKHWYTAWTDVELGFRQADISDPAFDLGERFDLINVANVLFHIPEEEKFAQALRNLARHLAPDGRVVTTEYMPRLSMRTQWMLVRSRYHFEQVAKAAGLRIAAVRAFSVFSNDPMGVDGADNGVRAHFQRVRSRTKTLFQSGLDGATEQFFTDYLVDIEQAIVAFCAERIADVDMPSQKLVVLAPTST